MINLHIKDAYKILEGKELPRELIKNLINISGEDIMDLCSLANKVRLKFSKDIHVCSISNIKSGSCGENCKYCAQSSHYNTNITNYPLVSKEQILKEAQDVINSGVKHFGLVASGKGLQGESKEIHKILDIIKSLKDNFPELDICLALGILDKKAAELIAKAGIYHYNHNLQVNPSEYEELVSTTHHITERVNTIKYLRELDVKVCSGGIFGLGETAEDRIELAYALKELDISVIPINVLVPIEGTPVYNNKRIDIYEVLKSVAIFRLIHPNKIIKLAAGRESVLNDYQALFMLSGINGMLTGGYLTTRGRDTKDDKSLLNELNKIT